MGIIVVCVLKHLKILVWHEGVFQEYDCSSDGIELGEPRQIPREHSQPLRLYFCENCGAEINGEDSFDEARDHLGKFHELKDPFKI